MALVQHALSPSKEKKNSVIILKTPELYALNVVIFIVCKLLKRESSRQQEKNSHLQTKAHKLQAYFSKNNSQARKE